MRTHASRILRCIASAAIVIAAAALTRIFPAGDPVSPALILLLAVLGIAAKWGFAEAICAAITGSLALDYMFYPPYGFSIESPEDWVGGIVFLVVGITTSKLSTRARELALAASARERDMQKLYVLGQAFFQSSDVEGTIRRGLEKIVEIFGVKEAVFYFQTIDQIFSAGTRSSLLSDDRLRELSGNGAPFIDKSCGIAILPLGTTGKIVGSLGLHEAMLSRATLAAIAFRFGAAVERAIAFEETARAEAARRCQELKSVLLDALAHETKTPLAAIKIAITSLLARNERRELSVELLRVVDEEICQVEQYLNHALQLARVDAGILELENGLHDARLLVESSCEELAVPLEGREMTVEIPDDLPPAHCDFQMAKLVLNELLTNALKYSPPGSPLGISFRLENDSIVVSVSDSGAGVAEEERTCIFDRNYRGDQGQRDIPGTGLGLTLAKSIVEAQGGQIWVEGHPHAGSVFAFSLPTLRETVP